MPFGSYPQTPFNVRALVDLVNQICERVYGDMIRDGVNITSKAEKLKGV